MTESSYCRPPRPPDHSCLFAADRFVVVHVLLMALAFSAERGRVRDERSIGCQPVRTGEDSHDPLRRCCGWDPLFWS